MSDLLQQIMQSAQPASLDGYYNYVDPNVQHHTYDNQLTSIGFVPHKAPQNMYTWSGLQDQNKDYTKAHEFEHTQQRNPKSVFKKDKFPAGAYLLADKLEPYFPDLPAEYQEIMGKKRFPSDLLKRNWAMAPQEFLADIAGLFRIHQDPKKRQEIEDILKSEPTLYQAINQNLYPTIPRMTESTWSAPKENTNLLQNLQRLIRNRTAY